MGFEIELKHLVDHHQPDGLYNSLTLLDVLSFSKHSLLPIIIRFLSLAITSISNVPEFLIMHTIQLTQAVL